MIVQIYAITSVDEALALAGLGVDHIGFVAGVYGQVHGELTFAQAQAIAKALKGKATSSALTMSVDIAEIERMVKAVQPDIVHISSDMEAVGIKSLATLRHTLPAEVLIMKAVSVNGPETIQAALQYGSIADILLLDTKVTGMPGVGATGVVHDWTISQQIIKQINLRPDQAKVILAGGLTPQNVAAAIRTTQPWGVDSNTGTNIPGDPLRKELNQVRKFVEQAKSCKISWDVKGMAISDREPLSNFT